MRDRIRELRRIRAGDLQPNRLNWRRHPEQQRRALTASLERLGYADALIARERSDGTLELIDGHLRAETTPDEQVPVLVVDLDDQEAAALLASLDPLAGMAETDDQALVALLASIQDETLRPLLELISSRDGHAAEEGPLPETPEEPITHPGDLWLLGDHRLLCGDATHEGDVKRLLGDVVPFICVTDPPYGVDYDPNWRNVEAAKGNLAYAARRVGEVPNDDRADWSAAWRLFPGDVIYSWHPAGATSLVHAKALQDSGFAIRMQIIWAKSNFPIGRGDYHVRHEPCWYAVREGQPARRTSDRTQTTLWEINLDANVPGGHSTQKPLECMARPIRNHETEDVYDPFLGSGTTLIAAEQLGRRCYALEIEPRYVDVAVKRWEAYTGQTASREAQ